MKIKYILICTFFCFSATQAQKLKLESANKKYEKLAFIDAIKIYEQVAEKGYKSVELFQKLGNANFFNANHKEAAKWYGELFSLSKDVDTEYYYRYSLCLKSMGQYKLADEYLNRFTELSNEDVRATLYSQNRNYLDVIKSNSGRFKIEQSGVSSSFSDYGAALLNDNFIFASARESKGYTDTKHSWTDYAFTNLFSATISEDKTLSNPTRLNKFVNSKFNESTAVFTKDGQTMYFTRNNYTNNKLRYDKEGNILLKLYKATMVDGQWANVVELPFNSDLYSVAHPALSTDENTLYFASNMEGTKGLSDLFKVKILGNDTYSTPENLGNVINTEGRETFPFVSKNNELFFASDGHPGLGGLDVFVTKLNQNQNTILNLGAPLNSQQDDFAFLIDSNTKTGYFTSNRDGGLGNDDIYKFIEEKPIVENCNQTLKGVITDSNTKELLPNGKVTLFDAQMKEISSMQTNEKAEYSFSGLDCSKQYYVRSENKDYSVVEKPAKTGAQPGGTTFVNLEVEKGLKPIGVGTDLAKVLNIPMIYFDLDKWYIRPDASVELQKILAVLVENPTMKIDVRSHTDCRNTDAYNKTLSAKRAKSTVQWLIEKGIDSKRLTGRGFGESELVNYCTDGVDCTEEEHQANRRSEFIIVSM